MDYTLIKRGKKFKKVISGIDHFEDEGLYILDVTDGKRLEYLKLVVLMLLPFSIKTKYSFEKMKGEA